MLIRIHTYTGLLTFVNLTLYAVVGIAALFDARIASPPVVWEQSFAVRAGQSDRDVAERVVRLLGLSLATPVHDFAIRHEAERHLVLDFYHANGFSIEHMAVRSNRAAADEYRKIEPDAVFSTAANGDMLAFGKKFERHISVMPADMTIIVTARRVRGQPFQNAMPHIMRTSDLAYMCRPTLIHGCRARCQHFCNQTN